MALARSRLAGALGMQGSKTDWWLKRGAIVPQGGNSYKRKHPPAACLRLFACREAPVSGSELR